MIGRPFTGIMAEEVLPKSALRTGVVFPAARTMAVLG
jgi:hypothetical protein